MKPDYEAKLKIHYVALGQKQAFASAAAHLLNSNTSHQDLARLFQKRAGTPLPSKPQPPKEKPNG